MVDIDLSYCECGCGEDYELQATLARDHIDGLHGVDHPACPVCQHSSMRRPGCSICTRYVTIHGTHEDHLRAIRT